MAKGQMGSLPRLCYLPAGCLGLSSCLNQEGNWSAYLTPRLAHKGPVRSPSSASSPHDPIMLNRRPHSCLCCTLPGGSSSAVFQLPWPPHFLLLKQATIPISQGPEGSCGGWGQVRKPRQE